MMWRLLASERDAGKGACRLANHTTRTLRNGKQFFSYWSNGSWLFAVRNVWRAHTHTHTSAISRQRWSLLRTSVVAGVDLSWPRHPSAL